MTAPLRGAWTVAWPPLAVLAAHAVLTTVAGHQEWLDPLFHFSGGFAGAVTLWRAFDRLPLPPRWTAPPRRRVAIVLTMLAVAVGWELMEFASDQLNGTHVQEGPLDTGSDIVLGVAGAVVFVVMASRRHPRPSDPRT